jgi:hypothetical protein
MPWRGGDSGRGLSERWRAREREPLMPEKKAVMLVTLKTTIFLKYPKS